jgi:hypothetical protein
VPLFIFERKIRDALKDKETGLAGLWFGLKLAKLPTVSSFILRMLRQLTVWQHWEHKLYKVPNDSVCIQNYLKVKNLRI